MTEKRKVLILGVDGMDPRLTKKYLDEGLMPNVQKYIERGACREDLVMLGAQPTITPPMWTTLATGTYPMTHGVTCFWNQHPTKIDTLVYANDSRDCKVERLWDVFAKAEHNTLVFHWPGSSWPPTIDSPYLSVIEGTQPTAVNFGLAAADFEQIYIARTEIQEIHSEELVVSDSGAGCVMTDMEIDEGSASGTLDGVLNAKEVTPILMDEYAGENENFGRPPIIVEMPLRDAFGWKQAPEGAKEFGITVANGLIRHYCLVLANEEGIYDRLAVYASKKETEPMVILHNEEYAPVVEDEAFKNGEKIAVTRSMLAFDIKPDGSSAGLWVGGGLQKDCDALFHPRKLYREIVDNVGYVRGVSMMLNYGSRPDIIEKVMLPVWRHYGDWQAASIKYLIEAHQYEAVFSHYHNVDNYGHVFWEEGNQHGQDNQREAVYERLMAQGYQDTDRYLGEFLPLLDEGWSIIITSDHGLLCKQEEYIQPCLGDGFGVNTKILRELGYTVMKRDENGQETAEIDWSKTRATAPRGNHIYLNLVGRQPEGIVQPSEQYALEQEIISELYRYRYHGKRIIALALRNKDAALIGMGGPSCGDIIYFLEEGFNRAHGDALSTTLGYADTSVSPIFIAAGNGVRQNYKTDRVIRQVDVAPTAAVLGGVRMPRDCEGAIVYQILEDDTLSKLN